MMMKLFVKLILFAVAFYYVSEFCNAKTAEFTLLNIQSDHSFNPEWEVNNPPLVDAENLFNQRFTYLGAGGQCFAFVSEDGNYVLKLCKHYLYRLPLWRKVLPLPSKLRAQRDASLIRRLHKLNRDFTSYKLCLEKLPEETGFLYVHLNKTNAQLQKVRIVDKLGIEHQIDLDLVDFVLQKKATMAYPHLLHLVEKGAFSAAKEAIDSTCSLILSRCQKGIYDDDAKIYRNFGFIGNKAMIVDGGRLTIDPKRQDPTVQLEDLVLITARLKQFLEGISPELAVYLQDCIDKKKSNLE